MPSVLHLIRHGPSSPAPGGQWVDASGFHAWRDGSDAVGLDHDACVPRSLMDLVAWSDLVVSSDLPRAVESALRLAPSRTVVRSHLFREAPLPVPAWVSGRWPVAVWEALIHAHWSYRILSGSEPLGPDLERAEDAIRWLDRLEGTPRAVAVITHGAFRRLLATRLREGGWRGTSRRRSHRCWSVWSFVRAEEPLAAKPAPELEASWAR